MSCLSWNCRRLGVPLTVQVLGDMIRLLNPGLVFLCETRCFASYVDSLKIDGVGLVLLLTEMV